MSTETPTTLLEMIECPVITPTDPGYDEARRVYNGMIDMRPAAIVRCQTVGDVIATVNAARESGLELAIRGGAHSVPGFGTTDGGIVCDLSAMTAVDVDPQAMTARVGGGATLHDLDAATYAHGLATVGGIISSTGVGGLTLGGGIGHLSRRFGLACDNLIAAEVVTAGGEVVRAEESENPDLFWALRGGSGNFGVVTAFEFSLHEVKDVYGGPIFYPVEHAGEVLRFYREFIATAPEDLGAFFAFQIAPPLEFIPAEHHGETMCLIVTCWSGDPDKGPEAIAPLLDAAPVVAQHIGVMPYPTLNSAFDALLPAGLQHYWKAAFVTELKDAAIVAHLKWGPKLPCVESTMHLYPIDGASHRVPADTTAWGHRNASFACVIAGMWPDPADNDTNIAWVHDYYEAIAPLSEPGGYINFLSADDGTRARDNYGANYERLRAVKRAYDPTNVFHRNQNIQP
ncbi:FAD-binding oxidoreductase [Microbacterium sp. CFH 90308]|uniref:FAD-binding oxidoreductase n=1 Tax=Microbacterium salsuginis TaxID=2722803 RepID=A0ABX1K8M1_9MICO|nr:FAD-binding oxidoreductase [Microbacterium sp. CFH 90308]NLP83354.1 FAD-binding oxidoreductase [Microbacterium sp. CFH 90308]